MSTQLPTSERSGAAAEEPVLYEVRDAVALITLNRPERLNAWTREMGTQYASYLEQAADDPAVRAIVLTGAGRGFCAGADMSMLHATAKSAGSPLVEADRFHLPLRIPKPIIAAVNGACAGLGFIHALMCDLRFAAAGVKFTTAFARRGLVAEYNLPWLLPRLVGQSNALDLLFSGRVFLAEEAKELGVVNRVYPRETLLEETLAYARELATASSPTSMAIMKQQVYGQLELGLLDGTRQTRAWMDASLRAPDFLEGVESFLEKRSPSFRPLPAGLRLDRIAPGFERATSNTSNEQ